MDGVELLQAAMKFIKGLSHMIAWKVRVYSNGQMEEHSSETSCTARNMVKAHIYGLMVRFTLVISEMMTVMVMVNCITQMAKSSMVTGKKVKSMAVVFTFGQMVPGSIVTILKVKNMGMVHLITPKCH